MNSMRLLLLLLLSLIMLALAEPVRAQDDSTFARIHSIRIDSTSNGFPFYFSPGYNRRANGMAAVFADFDAIIRDSLGVQAKVNVAMLADPDWHKLWPGSYGKPFLSTAPPWVVLIPAAPLRSVMLRDLNRLIGDDLAPTMLDNLGFLEAGRAYAIELLRPDHPNQSAPLRWFDDYLAQYVAYAALSKVAPDRAAVWDIHSWKVLEQGMPLLTTLDEYEKEYSAHLSSADGKNNFGWYQSLFAASVAEVYQKRGIGFLAALKRRLPERADEWTTPAVLEALIATEPHFLGWPDRVRE